MRASILEVAGTLSDLARLEAVRKFHPRRIPRFVLGAPLVSTARARFVEFGARSHAGKVAAETGRWYREHLALEGEGGTGPNGKGWSRSILRFRFFSWGNV